MKEKECQYEQVDLHGMRVYTTRRWAIPTTASPPARLFEDLPEDYVCPVCGVGKDAFEEEA